MQQQQAVLLREARKGERALLDPVVDCFWSCVSACDVVGWITLAWNYVETTAKDLVSRALTCLGQTMAENPPLRMTVQGGVVMLALYGGYRIASIALEGTGISALLANTSVAPVGDLLSGAVGAVVAVGAGALTTELLDRLAQANRTAALEQGQRNLLQDLHALQGEVRASRAETAQLQQQLAATQNQLNHTQLQLQAAQVQINATPDPALVQQQGAQNIQLRQQVEVLQRNFDEQSDAMLRDMQTLSASMRKEYQAAMQAMQQEMKDLHKELAASRTLIAEGRRERDQLQLELSHAVCLNSEDEEKEEHDLVMIASASASEHKIADGS